MGARVAVLLLVACMGLGADALRNSGLRHSTDAMHSFERETSGAAGSFSFESFNNSSMDSFSFNGVAALNEDHSVLSLANGTSNAGSLFYVRAMDLSNGFTSSFNVSLFSFTGGAGDEAPEGFTFIVSGAGATAIGGDAAGLGYASANVNGTDGIHSSLAVEFDFHTDEEMNDPSYSHVSVHSLFDAVDPNSANEMYSVGMAQLPYVASVLAETHSVDVTYIASNETLVISIDGEQLLEVGNLSMASAINGSVGLVGFTASNGDSNAAVYWVNSWSFTSSEAAGSSSYEEDEGSTDDGPTPLGIFAICGGLFLCFALCCLVGITVFISSEDLRNSLSKALKRNKAPQAYMPVSQEDDYTSALGIN